MKSSDWLVEYCTAQVGRPYWYGCFGQRSSEALLKAKKAQYPRYYTASNFNKQLGVKVHDCAGLIKGALWSNTVDDPSPEYNSKQDLGATGLYNNAKVKGPISTFPKTYGALVFKGTSLKKTHVGVYIGNDTVVEAKGHAYGTIESKLSAGGWTFWAECHLFEYGTPTPAPIPATAKYKVKTLSGSPLALRKRAKKRSELIVWMPNGSEITVEKFVTGESVYGSTSWAYATYKGKKGYCTATRIKKV